VGDTEEYQLRIPSRSAALANLDNSRVVNRAGENIKKISKCRLLEV